MLRLYVPAPPTDGHVTITDDELQHIRTRRLHAGDRLRVFDGSGTEHDVELTQVTSRAAVARVTATHRVDRESPLEVVLAPALLKGRKLDWVIEKATEAGVTRIVPVQSRYVVGHGDHRDRWQRIAIAAAKQCGRGVVPAIAPICTFADLTALPFDGLRLLAWEDEHARAVRDLPAAAARVLVAIGPEGGFADDEVARARAAGFVTVSLGPRILRAESASVVAATLCQHRWGDL